MMLAHIFVYGTLKRGQCRESCWPLSPTLVRSAWVWGALYDIGPYPALVAGSDRVAGELWSFQIQDLPVVLETLDVIEGTNQPGQHNEYSREIVEVTLLGTELAEPSVLQASIYQYARAEQLARAERVKPVMGLDGLLFAVWPSSSVAS